MNRTSLQMRVASWAWIALCGICIAYGYATYSGLYRWLAELQVSLIGRYAAALTAIVPFLILASPALIILRRDYLTTCQSARANPLAARRSAVILIALAAVSFILSGAIFLVGQRQPGSTMPFPASTPYDTAAMTAGLIGLTLFVGGAFAYRRANVPKRQRKG